MPIKKLWINEIRHQYINKFKSYLNSWKQYVRYSKGSRLSKQIKCHVSQGSTLGSLLFLYLVMISHVTKFLDPIMFVDDTNLFYLNELFENVNNKLANATDWCFANKLSIQAKKNLFFHKQTVGNNIPPKTTRFKVYYSTKGNRIKISRCNGWWKSEMANYIKLVESKISKNIGVLFKISLHYTYFYLYHYLYYDVFLIYIFIYKLWYYCTDQHIPD